MRLTERQVRLLLTKVPGWSLRGRRISRVFIFKDFLQGIRFLNQVVKLAEDMNHHPDITINYNRIRLSLTTHDEGGLTVKDFKLARRINRLDQTIRSK